MLWVFKGTRVPVRARIENIEGDATLGELLSWSSGVRRSQLEAVLEHAGESREQA